MYKLLIILLLLIICNLLPGGVIYDKPGNTIIVSDYSQEMPCTLSTLYRLARMNGWKNITRDESGKIFTVDANLQIGKADGSSTFFQVGDKEESGETLIVQGNVIISPNWFSVKNSNRGTNRLTLGFPDAAKIKCSLKIANGHTVYSNCIPRKGKRPQRGIKGGQLHIYNSEITCINGGRKNHLNNLYLYGDQVILKNSAVSYFGTVAAYGLNRRTGKVDNTIFRNGKYAMISSGWNARNCTFENLTLGIVDMGGPIRSTLTNCIFKDTPANVRLHCGKSWVFAIDCDFGKGKFDIRSKHRNKDKKNGRKFYPYLVSNRHLIVKVVDKNGNPISGALISIDGKSKSNIPGVIEKRRGRTGKDGMTPGKGNRTALILTEFLIQANDSAKASRTEFTYDLKVSASGFNPVTKDDLKLTISWDVIEITLIE